VSSEPPEFLYKYRSLASEDSRKNLERIFTHHEIYLPTRLEFNDPFDCRALLTLDGSRKQLRAYLDRVAREINPTWTSEQRKRHVHQVMRRGRDELSQYFEAVLKDLNDYLDTSVGIFCLTEKRDDILMWEHYADSHKGVCLQFSAGSLPFSEASPVRYQVDFPTGSIIATERDRLQEIATHTKAWPWRYEAEWRLVRNARGVRTFDSTALTGVILGALVPSDLRGIVTGWVKNHLTPIKLFEATLGKHEFRIDISPIPNS
jgi:hypothetical protein